MGNATGNATGGARVLNPLALQPAPPAPMAFGIHNGTHIYLDCTPPSPPLAPPANGTTTDEAGVLELTLQQIILVACVAGVAFCACCSCCLACFQVLQLKKKLKVGRCERKTQ